ncbi:MAG: peptidylprolyl isomerase [Roseobacter sp.]|jgi:peptidyl-prolyl cis-trans isomerase SurA
MNNMKNRFAALLLFMTVFGAGQAVSQGLFSPAVFVNDSVITEFEIEQRQRFLTLLNAPGSSRDAVVQSLIEERLRSQAVASAGLELPEEAITAGLEEFAQRVNLTAEEFFVILEENGVARETFIDFVTVGVSWREYIQARFGPRLEVTDAEIDQALGSGGGGSRVSVLLSEIIIPAPPDRLQEVEELAAIIAASQSEAEFSDYARQYSATATRDDGGRLPWRPVNELPPVLRPLVLALAPGEVTDPIAIPDAVALFQLRGIEETGVQAEEFAAIEYAAYYIPGGRTPEALAEAAKIRNGIDVCDDLYGVAQGQPPEVLERESRPPAELPNDFALELSKLDPGESSVALTRSNGQVLVFLMLCGRTAVINEGTDREEVSLALRSSRLNAIADSFMDQLLADARIQIQ